MDENVTPERRCPACGASMSAGTRFCGSCGMDSLPAEAITPAETPASAAAVPVASVAATAAVAPTATAAMQAESDEFPDGKPCKWCGTRNPQEATRCMACNATFPTPEGDEALERAAKARIQALESDLKQPKRGGWWPFRSR